MALGPNKQMHPAATSMHVCPSCEAPFLQPSDWSEASPGSWHVSLFCPNCDWSGDGVYGAAAVEQFDRELDRGAEELLADLERLSRSTMRDYVESFTAALAADQVLPEDF
jgi:hypothetical protein